MLFYRVTHMNSFHLFSRIAAKGLIGASFILPLIALAQTQGQQDVVNIVNNVLTVVRIMVTIVFVLSIVVFGWGIVQFILAAGDPTLVAKAKQFLFWGVVGMAVGATIFGLVEFLQRYFGLRPDRLIIQEPQVN